MLREFMPRSNKTVADGLAAAVVLTLELAKLARVRVRFNHVARFIVNANYSIMRAAAKLHIADCVADCVWLSRRTSGRE